MYHATQALGRVGRDPEVRYTASGQPVANFSVAVTEKFSGQEHTTWYDVQCWGKLAEDIVGKYVKKGQTVFCEGRMSCRKYTNKEGVEVKAWELVAKTVKICSGKRDEHDAVHGGAEDAGVGGPRYADDPGYDPDQDIPF